MVLETGRLESATRATRDELLLLKTEYERLQEGVVPPVHHLHNHALHYKENAAVLYSPENLENPAVLQAVEAHLAEHYLQLYGVPREGAVDPMTGMMSPGDPMRPIREAFLMGRAPDPTLLPPPPGMPPMGGPGLPPPPPELNAGPVGPPEVQMPTQPLTGMQFDNATGGGVSQPQ